MRWTSAPPPDASWSAPSPTDTSPSPRSAVSQTASSLYLPVTASVCSGTCSTCGTRCARGCSPLFAVLALFPRSASTPGRWTTGWSMPPVLCPPRSTPTARHAPGEFPNRSSPRSPRRRSTPSTGCRCRTSTHCSSSWPRIETTAYLESLTAPTPTPYCSYQIFSPASSPASGSPR